MVSALKNYGLMLLGLLLALILLNLLLNVLKKAPGIGTVAADAQNLANHGTLS